MKISDSVNAGHKLIRPTELKFCHGTISSRFRDGTPLHKMFSDILYGRLNLNDIPTLDAMYDPFRGNLCVIDGNRRLYVLQKLESYGVISDISVTVRNFDAEVFKRENSSVCKGNHVKIRGEIDVSGNIEQIWENRPNYFGELTTVTYQHLTVAQWYKCR